MTADRYYVKRPTGKVFGPFDKNAIQLMLNSNKLDADAQVSTDKERWIALTELPEFGGAPAGGFMDLPARPGAAAGLADLPARPGARAADDLPARVGGRLVAMDDHADLPARPGASPGLSDLPSPTRGGMQDLPSPARGGAGGGMDLPSLARGGAKPSDLPSLAGPPGLPSAVGAAQNLPRPAGPAALPTRAAGSGAPPPPRPLSAPIALEDDEPDFDLPPAHSPGRSRVDEDDLFGGPMSRGAQDEADDLFGPPPSRGGGDDLFEVSHGRADEDDLFGGPSPGRAAPGPSAAAPMAAGGQGAFEEDDLFGAPSRGLSASGRAQQEDDDLFGGGPQAFGRDLRDDLFADDGADGDDFLGGDQGFSFLDDKPSVSKQGLNTDSWGDDLMGGGSAAKATPAKQDSWGDDMLTGNASPAALSADPFGMDSPRSAPAAAPRAASQGASQATAASDPFRPASTGFNAQAAAAQSQGTSQGVNAPSAQTGAAQAAQADKKRALAMKVGVPLIIVAVLGGIAFGLTQFFKDDQASQPVAVTEVKRLKIELEKLKTANYVELREIINTSKKAQMKPDALGKVLVAHALVLALHPQDEETRANAQALVKQLGGATDGEAALGKGALDAVTLDLDTTAATLEPLTREPGEVGFFAKTFLGVAAVRAQAAAGGAQGKPSAKDASPERAPEQAPEQGQDQGQDMPAASPPQAESLQRRAQAWLEDAAKTHATLPKYWLARQAALEPDGRAQALKHYAASLKGSEDYVPTIVAKGQAHYAEGDLNDALKLLERVTSELGARAHRSELAQAHHTIGLVHSSRSQSDLAIQALTKALDVDTSRVDTLRALAQEYERAQLYKQALQFFTTNKNLGQKDAEVMLGIVRAHSGLKEWPQAIAKLEEGEKAFPQDARFSEQLGQINMSRGTFFEAQKSFERAVEIDATLVSALASLAQLSFKIDRDFERGESYVRKIVGQPSKITASVATEVGEFYKISGRLDFAKKWYAAAIKRDTNYWPARLSLSRMLLENGESEEALKLLERSRKEGVTDIRLAAYLADAYRQTAKYDRAIDEINRVIEKQPKEPKYIFIRGRIHFDRGNYETAIEDFNKAYELDTRFHEAYFYVGRTAFAQGDRGTALKIFRHVLDYQPNEGEFRFYMGQALEAESRPTQALEEYRKCTEVEPGYGVRNPRIYIARGRLLSRLGESRAGKKDLARALELAPEMLDALLAMGEADYRDQSYETAIKHFTKALDKEPKHPDAQHKLGMSYIFLKRNREGARHLQLALSYGSDNAEIYRTLGFLYKEMGQRKEALEAFQTYWQRSADRKIPAGARREILNQIKELGG